MGLEPCQATPRGAIRVAYLALAALAFWALRDAATVGIVDRWRIAAYIRVLQLSQNANLEDVPPDQREAIDKGIETPPPPKQEPAK